MKQVKIFSNGLPHTVERQVNNWLQEKQTSEEVLFELIDVKYSESDKGFSAMVIYSLIPAKSK